MPKTAKTSTLEKKCLLKSVHDHEVHEAEEKKHEGQLGDALEDEVDPVSVVDGVTKPYKLQQKDTSNL